MSGKQAIISYIPALHQGYIKFFNNYPEATIYVLPEDFIKELPRMERDIRALAPVTIQKVLQAILPQKVKLLNNREITRLIQDGANIIMPDEDLNRHFANQHLKGQKVTFVSTFLRWDKQISSKEAEVSPGRTISSQARDKEVIGETFKESERSPDWWRQIGAIVVKDKKVLFIGHNQPVVGGEYSLNTLGDPRGNFNAGENIEISKFIHAEANLIARAARRGVELDGASIYVTTFPCPVCAKLIATAGFKRVYYTKGYSLLDAEDIFQANGIEVVMVKTD